MDLLRLPNKGEHTTWVPPQHPHVGHIQRCLRGHLHVPLHCTAVSSAGGAPPPSTKLLAEDAPCSQCMHGTTRFVLTAGSRWWHVALTLLYSVWKHSFALSTWGTEQPGKLPPTFAPPDSRAWSETDCLPKHLLALPSGRKCFSEALCSLL